MWVAAPPARLARETSNTGDGGPQVRATQASPLRARGTAGEGDAGVAPTSPGREPKQYGLDHHIHGRTFGVARGTRRQGRRAARSGEGRAAGARVVRRVAARVPG